MSIGKKPIFSLTVLLLSFFLVTSLSAKLVTENQVISAVEGWLKADSSPFNTTLTPVIKSVQEYNNDGSPFFVVFLDGLGTVIVAGEDNIEPVIAFFNNIAPDSPSFQIVLEFVAADMKSRFACLADSSDIKSKSTTVKSSSNKTSQQLKWSELIVLSESVTTKANNLSSVSHVRVNPLLASKWSQTTHDNSTSGLTCYNYHTPNNYPSGCVATAMAQIVKFWQYPQTGVSGTFNIKVNGVSQSASLLGGTLPGGGYDFSLMTDVPSQGVTTSQRDEIGRLCYDAGVAVGMSYYSAGSSSYLADGASALMNVFAYTSAKYASDDVALSGGLTTILNTNLDAGLPLILGILDSVNYYGHAVIVDGYGYNFGTPYHHVNMGWAGYADFWYNLPLISYGTQNYNLVTDCIYNISPSISGEIISGRVTDEFGNPLPNINVTASDGTNSFTTSTNYYGIYAFTAMASKTDYVLTADSIGSGYVVQFYFMSKHVSTGQSGAYDDISGNVWADDIIAYMGPQSPVAIAQEVTTSINSSLTISLTADDDGYIDPMTTGEPDMYITRLPLKGHLSEPGGTTINSVPYKITNSSNQVVYNHVGDSSYIDDFEFQTQDLFGFGSAQVNITIPTLSQGFENTNIQGWYFVDGNSPRDGSAWNYCDITTTPKSAWYGSVVVLALSYDGSSPNDSLVYSSVNTTMYPQGFRLSFSHVFRTNTTSSYGIVELSPDNSNWVAVPGCIFFANSEGTVQTDITPAILPGIFGSPNLRIRWRYSASNDMYWGIDEVKIIDLKTYPDRVADIDNDRDIDMMDLTLLAFDWLNQSPIYNSNINNDAEVDLADFAILAQNWLALP